MNSPFVSSSQKCVKHSHLIILFLSSLLLLLSFEPLVYSVKRSAADGHAYAFMAKQFIADPSAFFSYAPPPAHAYGPEVLICMAFYLLFPHLAAWQVIGLANVTMTLLFVWLLAFIFPKAIAGARTTEAKPRIASWQLRTATANLLLAFLNYSSHSAESFFGLDGTNAQIGSYATTLVLISLFFGKYGGKTKLAMIIFSVIGTMSSKLVLASAIAPLMALIVRDSFQNRTLSPHNKRQAGLLALLFFVALIPNLILGDMEALQRTRLSISNIYPTLELWQQFLMAQWRTMDPMKCIYVAMLIALLAILWQNRRHPIVFVTIAALLACFAASLVAGTFRGWNLRYLGGGLFLAAGFWIATQSALSYRLTLAIATITIFLGLNNDYDFAYPQSREQSLAACLAPLVANERLTRGLAGHWDSEPINNILDQRLLIKARLSNTRPEPYAWMVDTRYNNFHQNIDFALENKANRHYHFSSANLRALPGHKGTLSCADSDTTIHLYDAKTFSNYLRGESATKE